MSTEIVRREESAFELGKVFAESGMFPNVRKAAEAVVKIIAGREFGLGPMAAMNGIHMVDGKPTLAANLIAGQIKRHPSYDYKVTRREDTGCTLEFFEDGKSLGEMTWDAKDATAAGLIGKMNWKKYPRDMYFARCLTAGARTYCPDVLGGSPIYTAEELGADTAETPSAPASVSRPDQDWDDAARRDAIEVVTDAPSRHAETDVADAVEMVGQSTLGYLRERFKASGKTNDDLAWMLLSVGVESLPENPKPADIATAMKGLTKVQAVKLGELFEGEDDAVPGSGETA